MFNFLKKKKKPRVASRGLNFNELSAKATQLSASRHRKSVSNTVRVRKNLQERMRVGSSPSKTYSWKVIFDVKIEQQSNKTKAKVVVPIYAKSGVTSSGQDPLVPSGSYGAPLTKSIKSGWKTNIKLIWEGAVFVYNGHPRREIPIEFDIIWYEGPGDYNKVVCIMAKRSNYILGDDGTIDMGLWGSQDGVIRNGTKYCAIAHEFGHLIGNPDEYNRVTFNGRVRENTGGIMGHDVTSVPKPGHFYLVGNAIARHLNLNTSLSYIVYRGERYQISKNHPWA